MINFHVIKRILVLSLSGWPTGQAKLVTIMSSEAAIPCLYNFFLVAKAPLHITWKSLKNMINFHVIKRILVYVLVWLAYMHTIMSSEAAIPCLYNFFLVAKAPLHITWKSLKNMINFHVIKRILVYVLVWLAYMQASHH